jgi:hypothetical protein
VAISTTRSRQFWQRWQFKSCIVSLLTRSAKYNANKQRQRFTVLRFREFMRRSIKTVVLCVVFLAPTIVSAQVPTISFATVEQGRAVLTNRDDFVSRLSPFDHAARMKTDRDVTEQEYLAFVAKNVLEWTSDEKDAVQSAFDGLAAKLSDLNLPFPKTILFIKTTGDEEGHAEYTRGNAIILPQKALAANRRSALPGTIAHELFHVLSRNAPGLRERAYAVIGFQPCGEVPFPPTLAARKITNPDAPKNDYCIRVESGERQSGPYRYCFQNPTITTRRTAASSSTISILNSWWLKSPARTRLTIRRKSRF